VPDTDPLVVDASVAAKAALVVDGFTVFGDRRLVAPSLLWSEATSALRQLEHRSEITVDEAGLALDRLHAASIDEVSSHELAADALALSRQLGWAKTYDAEYLALARRLGTVLVTLDARLLRGAAGIAQIVAPADVEAR
jgi:predicted nucleic acid-binding protein